MDVQRQRRWACTARKEKREREERRRRRARDVLDACVGAPGPQVGHGRAIWDSSGPKLGLRRALDEKNSLRPPILRLNPGGMAGRGWLLLSILGHVPDVAVGHKSPSRMLLTQMHSPMPTPMPINLYLHQKLTMMPGHTQREQQEASRRRLAATSSSPPSSPYTRRTMRRISRLALSASWFDTCELSMSADDALHSFGHAPQRYHRGA